MKIVPLIIAVILVAGLLTLGVVLFGPSEPVKLQTTAEYSRIISLAPNITEILYALGLGDKIIGVTRYCKYPPEAMTKKKVGGYLDANYEAIVSADPDLVIVLREHIEPVNHFARLGIETLAVEHTSIKDILESIVIIGKSCGAAEKAERLAEQLGAKIGTIKKQTENLKKLKVLICIERDVSRGSFESVYIAGRDGFYDEMIELGGGVNAYTGRIKFPKVGQEGLIAMNPDVMIDIISDIKNRGLDEVTLRGQWEILDIGAVEKKQVYIFSENYVAIPGPRFILTLERIAKAIHPEIKLKKDN